MKRVFPPLSLRLMILAIGILCLATSSVFAGDDDVRKSLTIAQGDAKQIITLADGSSLVGQITAVGENDITFVTEMGEMTIEISRIKEVKEIKASSMKEGTYWFPNPNQTRLYFAPTGRMLKTGEGYFSDVYLFFPGFAYGITDNITIGGGFSIFPGVDFDKQLFYFQPRVGVDVGPSMDLSISALLVRIPGDGDSNDDDSFDDLDDIDLDDSYIAGILFASGTFGSEDNHFTAGLGYGFADGEAADKPAVLLGGELRISRRMSFVSENWVFPSVDQPLASYGVRFFGEKLAVDLALFSPLGEDAIFPGIPYLDFVWNF